MMENQDNNNSAPAAPRRVRARFKHDPREDQMRKAAVITVILMIAVAALPSVGCGTPSVIKIGVIAEITGSIPAVGTSCKNGATLAAKQINDAGGVTVAGAKHKVELVIKDSANRPEQAVSMAKTLIDQDGVLAIVGPNATGDTLPAAAETEKSGVVLVTPWSTSPKTTLDGEGKPKKFVFRVCVTAAYESNQLAKFARSTLKAAAAAVLYDETADVLKIQAEDFRNSFTAAGGNVVAYEAYKPADNSYSAQLAKIKAASAAVLFLPTYYTEVPAILQQSRAAGITAQFIGSNGWSTPDLIASCGQVIEGSYLFNMYSPESKDPLTRKFVRDYQAAYNGVPDDVAALSYDAVGLIKKGLEDAANADRASLDASMLKIRDFAGATGDMRFSADSRDPFRGAVILKVENGQFKLFKELPRKATKDDVVSFVKEAVAYAKKNGKEKALAAFSDKNGPFEKGELYIFAYDFNGNVIAHGGDQTLIGKNLMSMTDPNGLPVIQELTGLAKQGGGWLDYMWPNPQDGGKVEGKVGYVVKVDNTCFLGSGIYVQ